MRLPCFFHSLGFEERADVERMWAGAGHKGAHNIYIWDRVTGALAKILEGPKDPCEDLTVRRSAPPPCLASNLEIV